MKLPKHIFGMPFCILIMSFLGMFVSCQNEHDKVYTMRIHCDAEDIVSVNVRKGDELNTKSVDLSDGAADVRLDKTELKNVGRITVVFKSKKHGEIEYVDGPVLIGRYLYVNCYDGKIVIKVVKTGYL